MRKLSGLLVAPALTVLMAVTILGACGGGRNTAAPGQGSTSSNRSSHSTGDITSTGAQPEAVVPAEPLDASTDPVSPTSAPTPGPSGGGCDPAVVHDAIAGSEAVGADVTFKVTYLKCIDDYGWASIAADYGEGATVFFEGSGTDITLLDLGSSVCPMDSGMPESVATRLAPPGSHWRGECGS